MIFFCWGAVDVGVGVQEHCNSLPMPNFHCWALFAPDDSPKKHVRKQSRMPGRDFGVTPP
jgi:hypothetical protein